MNNKKNNILNTRKRISTSKSDIIGLGTTIFVWVVLKIFFLLSFNIFCLLFRKHQNFNNIKLIIGVILYFLFFYILKYIIKECSTLSVAEYIAFKKVKFNQIFVWFIIPLLIIIVSVSIKIKFDSIDSSLINKRISSYNMTTIFIPLLFLKTVFFAPIYEEIMCRGFLFRSFQNSRLGNVGTVLLTTFLWSFTHFHFTFAEMSSTFIFGCVFGICRLKTKSILLPIFIHILINFSRIAFLCFYL